MIGKGYTVKAARMEMNMIAEGYFAVKSVMNKVQGRNLELPICTAVYSVLYENNPAAKAFRKLEEQLH
jgi:glycerol-3-phosphate dehydrogenase (NAD(P)+)